MVQNEADSFITPRLLSYFQSYDSYHGHQRNKITHYIGIPMILVAVLGLLGQWVISPTPFEPKSVLAVLQLDLGLIALVLASVWYVYVDWRIGLSFSLFLFGVYLIARMIPAPVCWIFFVLGWFLQFIGHLKYEKKSPAFMTNAFHLLVGPLWIFAKSVGYYEGGGNRVPEVQSPPSR